MTHAYYFSRYTGYTKANNAYFYRSCIIDVKRLLYRKDSNNTTRRYDVTIHSLDD